jgi:hypothetical protein
MPRHPNEKALTNESDMAASYAMTLEEIGARLGLNRQTVWTIYQRALRKLRRKSPRTLSHLRGLASELDSNRRESLYPGEPE